MNDAPSSIPSDRRAARRRRAAVLGAAAALLAGCATTRVTLNPSAPGPVCERAATARVAWAPRWRADQKDVPAREAAAAAGLERFLASSGCFARWTLQRLTEPGPAALDTAVAQAPADVGTVVIVVVRELGPVVRLMSSAALVEGGTEVVLDIVVHDGPGRSRRREFTVHWQHGGPGVVKGVESLPSDLQAALAAALQPAAGMR